MGLNYYASSPTVVLPPQQSSHYFSNRGSRRSPFASSYVAKYPMPPSLNYLAAASNSTAGRKRSIADIDDPDEHLPSGSTLIQEPPKPKPEPIYGPGMTLIYPDEPGLNISAESQTGTWAEDKHDKEEQVKPELPRPIAVSRKSQRLDTGVCASPVATQLPATTIVVDEHGNTMDALIKALGIGWKTIKPEAARAYSRYIENHYDLTQTEIMLESEGRSAYLVRATHAGVQQFLLFDESLAWCQPAGMTLPETVQNLVFRPHPWADLPKMAAQSRSSITTPPTPVDMMDEASMASNSFAAIPQQAVLTPPMDTSVDDDAMQM